MVDGHRVIMHGGGSPGFVSMLATCPDDSLTVVVLVNTAGPMADSLAALVGRRALSPRRP